MANEERATPYNRPLPQGQPPAPEDPTAARLVEGGVLKLNNQDRAGLESWFQQSFINQFSENSWFTRDWLPQFMAPLYHTVNKNFDAMDDSIDKTNEDVLKLREEVLIEVSKARKEIVADVAKAHDDMQREMNRRVKIWDRTLTTEIAKIKQVAIDKCNADLNIMRNDLLRVVRMDMINEFRALNVNLAKTRDEESSTRIEETVQAIQTAADTAHTEMKTIYNADLQSMHADILHVLRQELAHELIKMRKAKKT